MGKVVQLSARMKSRASYEIGSVGQFGAPAIRLMPMTKAMIEETGLPATTTWAWAIVQLRPGQPDALLVGGPADSMSEAEARAREAFRELEEKWARERLVTRG